MAELHVGVLAEDETDCKVIDVLLRRIGERRGRTAGAWKIRRRYGKGCSHLRRRAERWLQELSDDGCAAAVLVHDLDRDPQSGALNDEARLERELSAIPVPRGLSRLVCIPVEEIEAWFFTSEVILKAITDGKAKPHASPHLIRRPKEELIRLSLGANRKPRYSQNDNERYARDLDIDECARRCPAFHKLHDFAISLLAQPRPRPTGR